MTTIDLNLGENVLNHLNVIDAIRELISNAFDAKNLSKSTHNVSIKYNEKKNILEIINYDSCIEQNNFIYTNNKLKRNKNIIGMYGYGLKDALAILYKRNIPITIETNKHKFTTKLMKTQNTDTDRLSTLHVILEKKKNIDKDIYNKITLENILKKDYETITNDFIELFNKKQKILYEDNIGNKIYKLDGRNQHIFVNGVRVITKSKNYFSYDFVKDDDIIKVTNRDRRNINNDIFVRKITKIWNSIKIVKDDEIICDDIFDNIKKILKSSKTLYELNKKDIIRNLLIQINSLNTYIFIDKKDDITKRSIKKMIEESKRNMFILGECVRNKFKTNNKKIKNISELNNKFIFYNNNSCNNIKIYTLKELEDPLKPIIKEIDKIITELKDKFNIELDEEVEESLKNIKLREESNINENLSDEEDFLSANENSDCESDDNTEESNEIYNNKLKGNDYDFTNNPMEITKGLLEDDSRLKSLIFNYILHHITEEEKISIFTKVFKDKGLNSWFTSWFST